MEYTGLRREKKIASKRRVVCFGYLVKIAHKKGVATTVDEVDEIAGFLLPGHG